MNSEYNSIENQKRAEEMKEKRENELFLKYCPEPEWLDEDELTEKEKEILNNGKLLVREKFIANMISGKIRLQDEEKSIFDGWQENEKQVENTDQQEVKQEKNKEKSWYEKMTEEKSSVYIQVKIPTNTEYCEQKQTSEGNVEGYKEWFIGYKEKPTSEVTRGFKLSKANNNGDLVVAKKGKYLIVEFRKNYAQDKTRYREHRDAYGWIAYQPSEEMLKNIWDDLKKDSSKENVLNLIDPKLKELIFSERDLSNIKIVLDEKE